MAGILLGIGVAIVEGMATKVGEEGMGWVLHQIGIGGDESNDVGEELGQIEDAINGVKRELKIDTEKILKELKVIEQQQLYQAWETRDTQLQKYITQINVQYSRFLDYAQNPKTTSKSDVENLVQEILDTNSGAAISLAEISTLISGSGADKGVLELYREMTAPIIQDGKIYARQGINSYFQYYMNAAYAECTALYLLIEAFHFQNNRPLAKKQFEAYRKYAYNQENPFISNLQYLMRAGCTSISLFGGKLFKSDEKVKSRQDYWAQAYFVSGYDSNTVRAKAERIFCNSLALSKSENRIAINMVYDPWTPQDVNSVLIPIISASKENPVDILPSREDEFTFPGVDMGNRGGYSGVAELKLRRMIYENVPGDIYRMKDLNNTSGLENQNGSGTKVRYFQDPKYLQNTFIVNTGSRHNSMDFRSFPHQRKFV